MANQNLSQFTEKLFVADADHTFIWDTVGAISKRVSRNSWLSGTTADFHLGLADAASPVAQTISVQSVVAGTSNTAGANLSINGSQGTGTGAGGSLLLRTAPAGSSGTAQNALVTAVAITSAGNVGIGTTAPSEKLHVVGGAQFEAASPFINLKSTTSGQNYYIQSQSNAIGTGTGNYLAYLAPTGKGHTWTEATTTRMVIEPTTGNVGIGTTSPTSKLHVAETWNNAGTAFCAIKSVITDTNSLAGSDFLELYSGTSTQPLRFDVQKTGQMNIYGAWTDTSNYERLSFSAPSAANAVIGTNKAGTGTARGLELQTDGVTRMTIGTGGDVNLSNSLVFGGLGQFRFLSSGVAFLTNSAQTDFGRLCLGGNTASAPALKRSTTYLQARLADDSAFTHIQGKLTTDTAYTGTVVAATGYITIYDSTGTAYRVPCAV